MRGRDHFIVVLGLLLAALVFTGLDGRVAQVSVAALNSMAMLAAFRLLFDDVASRLRVALLVALAVVGWGTAAAFDPDEPVGASAWLIQAVILVLVTVSVLRRILTHERITVQTLAGALSIYVLVGMLFGMVYGAFEAATDEVLLAGADGAREDPIYYSFVTLTTLGFGDVVSSSGLIRRITVVEAMVGQVFLATMVARLVSVFGSYRDPAPPRGADAPPGV